MRTACRAPCASLIIFKPLTTAYLLLFEDSICPFPNNLASYNSIQKKDDKVHNKRKRERKVEIDSQRRSKFWLVRMREKQKSCVISSD